jgi:multisubunit Na+/H+ antiporter MnhG subunit
MPTPITTLVILASALYSVVALFSFYLFYSPFAGMSQIGITIIALAAAVLTPYALLLVADLIARDSVTEYSTAIATIATALIGGYIYFFSFNYNDGEYALVYIITPLIQSPFVLAALGVAVWRRHRRNKDAT